MGWRNYHNLLVKYGGQLKKAERIELDRAAEDCRESVVYQQQIAQIHYDMIVRRKKQIEFI